MSFLKHKASECGASLDFSGVLFSFALRSISSEFFFEMTLAKAIILL
jgi:hypothetical protein